MSELICFTRNHSDLSTDKGYQFDFFCDICGNGYRSPYQANVAGTVGEVVRGAASLFGGLLGTRFGELEQELRRLTHAMYDRTAQALAQLVPGAPVRELAVLLRQGKAVRQERVAALAPTFWPTFAPDRQAALDRSTSAAR